VDHGIARVLACLAVLVPVAGDAVHRHQVDQQQHLVDLGARDGDLLRREFGRVAHLVVPLEHARDQRPVPHPHPALTPVPRQLRGSRKIHKAFI
jgi:hypothetical protein